MKNEFIGEFILSQPPTSPPSRGIEVIVDGSALVAVRNQVAI